MENNWLFNDLLKDKLVLTLDGLFRDPIYNGTSCIVNNKVYRATKFVKIGNWLDWLKYLNEYPTIKSIFKIVYFDLDDRDCCADGFIGVRNKDNSVVGCPVPWNNEVHETIYEIRGVRANSLL